MSDAVVIVLIAVLGPAFYLALGLVFGRWILPDPQRVLRGFVKRNGLTLPPELSPWAGNLLLRRHKQYIWGMAIGGALGVEVIVALPSQHGESAPLAPILFLPMWAGPALLIAADELWRIRRANLRSRPRVAHATATTLADYLSPIERAGCAALALSPLLLVCGLPAIPRDTGGIGESRWSGLGPLLLASGLMIGCVLAAVAMQRMVVASRQHATTSAVLAFEDALRAQTLRSIAIFPAILGVLVTTEAAELLADQTTSAAWRTLLGATWWILVAAIGALALIQFLLHSDTRYRRRLWASDDRP